MNRFATITILILIIALIQSCADNSTGPDFSEVPAPFDTTNSISSTTSDDGLTIYVIEEGGSNFAVTKNDQISVHFTGRKTDGTVFESSYEGGSTEPTTFQNLTAVPRSGQFGTIPPLVDGFRRGLMEMQEGEKRTIVVPPSLGYEDSREDTGGFDLRNDTLIYDVELVEILNP